ncbi:MAG: glucokinase [Steroidobacteraceae bacterium]
MDLVADIGGTNARFALVQANTGALQHARTLAAADHPDLASAVRVYLASIGQPVAGPSQALRSAAFAVAAPTQGGRIEFTNSPWAFDREALRRAMDFQQLVVLNDFEALALAIPDLPASTLRPLKRGAADPAAPCAVLGPGTGLGVAALLPPVEGAPSTAPRALRSQGGHVGFAPADDIELELLRFMRRRVDRVGTEQLLSGRGLTHLCAFFATRAGAVPEDLAPATVSARALAGDDPVAREAALRFWALLGSFAGDVALSFGAWGGVYIGGGVAPRLLPLFDLSDFVARFDAKQPMGELLAPVPVTLIDDPHAALHGAARARCAEGSRASQEGKSPRAACA